MRKSVLIGGIGNVLLGDDAIGPYVISLLESQYSFGDGVEIADLGTPALDITHRIAGLQAVIFVDCVASDDHRPGTVLLFRKSEMLCARPTPRLDPHSPALSECLLTTEMLGTSPQQLLLVGVVGEYFDPGRPLSQAVRQAAEKGVAAVLSELKRLQVEYRKRLPPVESSIWWADDPSTPGM